MKDLAQVLNGVRRSCGCGAAMRMIFRRWSGPFPGLLDSGFDLLQAVAGESPAATMDLFR